MEGSTGSHLAAIIELYVHVAVFDVRLQAVNYHNEIEPHDRLGRHTILQAVRDMDVLVPSELSLQTVMRAAHYAHCER